MGTHTHGQGRLLRTRLNPGSKNQIDHREPLNGLTLWMGYSITCEQENSHAWVESHIVMDHGPDILVLEYHKIESIGISVIFVCRRGGFIFRGPKVMNDESLLFRIC